MSDLAAAAARLRELHRPGQPLLLANAWDPASARLVEAVGLPAVATSSAAVNAALGGTDGDSMDPDVAFDAVRRIAAAVAVPVTADIEAGYQLAADGLVERLLAAGAVGCNLEDTDHHGEGVLVDAEAHAQRLGAVKDAARRAGVDLVLNARVDTVVRRVGEGEEQWAETLRRATLYRDAGADCVYPIGLEDEARVAALVEHLQAPVNVMYRRGGPTLARLSALGVARVSLASGVFRLAMARARSAMEALRDGDDAGVWG